MKGRRFNLNERQVLDALRAIDIHVWEGERVRLGLPVGAPVDGDDAMLVVYTEEDPRATGERP